MVSRGAPRDLRRELQKALSETAQLKLPLGQGEIPETENNSEPGCLLLWNQHIRTLVVVAQEPPLSSVCF